jgi:PI4-kinase N-terminal region
VQPVLPAGALADALEELASGLKGLPQDQCLTASQRMLALFSEFGLSHDLSKHCWDLVTLLPAVAVACEAVRATPAVCLPGDESATAHGSGDQALSEQSHYCGCAPYVHAPREGANMVLASLDSLCAHDSATVKLFRNAWLYCGMLGLGVVPPHWLKGWPRAQRCIDAMGRLAASTPVLIYGTGVAKEHEAEERVSLELQPHLSAGAERGTPAAIASALRRVLIAPPKVPEKNASNAFLLAIATLEISRVAIGPLPPASASGSPLIHTMAYAGGSRPSTVDHAVYVALMDTAFDVLSRRLTSPACHDAEPFQHLERLADVLIQSICTAPSGLRPHGRKYSRKSDHAEEALAQLVNRAPALHYSRACIESWVTHGAADEDGMASERLGEWLATAATRAPTHMEHVVQSLGMASGCADSDEQASVCMMVSRPTRLLDAVDVGRRRSNLDEPSTSHLAALTSKSAAMGRVGACIELQPDAEERILASLRRIPAAMTYAQHRQLCSDAGASIVSKLQSGEFPLAMLVALAQLPLLRFTGSALRNVTFAWHWVIAESAAARDALVAHMLPVWQSTLQRSLGLFSGTWVPPSIPLSSGDLRSFDALERDASLLDGLRAHHAWILCLLEVWESSRHATIMAGASPMLPALLGIFRCTLASPAAISSHPLGRMPLFRFLTLVLRFVKHLASHPPADGGVRSAPSDLLRDTLALGLHSFAGPAGFVIPQMMPVATTLNALAAFSDAVSGLQVCTTCHSRVY